MEDDLKDQGSVGKTTVTSAEIVRSFGKWRDASLTAPVFITAHGRTTHVLTGLRLYQQLTHKPGDSNALATEERLTGLAEWLKESVILCTPEEEIIYANARARQYCRLPPLRKGLKLTDAMPDIEGSVMQVQYRRTLSTREGLTADLPSVFEQGCWTQLTTIPLGDRLVLMMRDITEEVERYRMADMKQGMLDAISFHHAVAYVRISPRGLIERSDASFAEWIGLKPEKLLGTRLQDLAVREDRIALRNLFDLLFEENTPQQAMVELTPNNAERLRVHLSMVPLHGAYGMQGASIIMTRA